MSRPSLALPFLLLAASCGGGHILTGRQTLRLHPNDGLFVIAVDTNRSLSLTFCRDADVTSCTDVGPLDAAHPIAVAQVEAGRYCLMTIDCQLEGNVGGGGLGAHADIPPERSRCMEVHPGVVTYPGHFVLQATDTAMLVEHFDQRWSQRPDVIRAELDAAYPNLRRIQLQQVGFQRHQ